MSDLLKGADISIMANIYFDGKVISRTVLINNQRKTLGVILPGEYLFPVEQKEVVKLVSGNAEVLLPNEKTWEKVSNGETFVIDSNSSYKIKCKEIVEYICSYIEE